MLAGVSILVGLIVAFLVLASLLRKGQHHQAPSSNQGGLTAAEYANYGSCSWSQWRLPTGEIYCCMEQLCISVQGCLVAGALRSTAGCSGACQRCD